MVNTLIRNYSQRYLPRWIVLVFDSISTVLLFYIAYALRTNFDLTYLANPVIHVQAVMMGLTYMLGYLFWGTYKGVIRLTNQFDAIRLIRTISILALIVSANSILISYTEVEAKAFAFPLSVIIIHAVITFGYLLTCRLIVREIYETHLKGLQGPTTRTIIYGAGAAGLITKHTIERETKASNNILAFIDDNQTKVGKYIEGIPVFHPSEVFKRSFILKNRIREIIISIQHIDKEKRNQIVEQCLALNLRVKQIPSVQKWINGELSYNQIRNIKIEDLLERDPIKLDSGNVSRYIRGKRILVTGAAGSIGSEIARQLLHFNPKELLLLDQAETPLFDIENELRSNYASMMNPVKFILANVKDLFRMESIFSHHKPDIIFHAAAYKHVPLMEENPYEAIYVNVFGTKTIADLAVEHGVEKFVMISTDKAVNPTNVMGASKRVAEIYTQALSSNQSKTQFITTRFGNVLGSNGSVIPLFKKQIEKGGPLTLTHKDVKRYFMTITEACNLVLEAGAMGNGGEIFIFDMGKAVKIYDLACKMIVLSGLVLDKDISIEIVGLRPGEKLFEELLTNKENTIPTHHHKIMKARVNICDFQEVNHSLESLAQQLVDSDDYDLVRVLKSLVPEYKSNNSRFESLDIGLQSRN